MRGGASACSAVRRAWLACGFSFRIGLPAVAVWLSVALVAAVISPSAASAAFTPKASGGRSSLSPVSALRAAVNARRVVPAGADRQALQLGVAYSAAGARMTGSDFAFTVGQASVGRTGSAETIIAGLSPRRWGASYGSGGVVESFRAVASGIEQSFDLRTAPRGTGALSLRIPVSGLAASKDGTAVDLRDAAGHIRATYTGLHVRDASGKTLAASMRPISAGVIGISVDDSGARYPLVVDPTWSQTAELTSSDGSAYDNFGFAVAVSGTMAVVGAPYHMGTTAEGAVYVFEQTGGSWSQTAELTASDGVVNDCFGSSVAISGTTVVVGDPCWNASSYAGAAYVFALNNGTWTQTAELTASDGASNDQFGTAVAVSGSTVVVGAPYHQVGSNLSVGAAYVYSQTNGTWSQAAEFTPSDGKAGDLFGLSVATSGSDVFVGAEYHVNGVGRGTVYWFSSETGAAWIQTAEMNASDETSADAFGESLSLAGSTLAVGDWGHTVNGNANEGAVYLLTISGSSWSQQAELTPSNGQANDAFGWAVSATPSTVLVGEDGNTGAYIFAGSASNWVQSAELAPSNPQSGNEFGYAVGLSGQTAIVGAYNATVGSNSSQGSAYMFSDLLVQPQGSAVAADSHGGGSPSEPCQCSTSAPAQPSVVDPVNTATGDLHETVTDLHLAGPGVPLDFVRTYDAQLAQTQAAAALPAPPLGYGWSYNFDMSLSYTAATQTAVVNDENGAQVTFTQYVSGSSPAWCTPATNFCSSAPRIEASLNLNANGTWTYQRITGDEETFTFSSTGALESVADPAGNTLNSSTYIPANGQTTCPSGDTCTAWTSSASGRALVLASTVSGQLNSVFDANSSLGATFSYTGSGCTSWGTLQTPDLCEATDPGNLTAVYGYDSTNPTASLDYDMLTETPPGATSAATNLFDSQGRVTQQTDPAGAVTTFAYAGTNSSLDGGTTTVTQYPAGTGTGKPQNITVYQYSSNVLVEKTGGTGTASATSQIFQRDPVSLLPLSSLDGNGNQSTSTYQTYSSPGGTPVSSGNALTSTDAAGNTIQHAYNSFNQAWCTVDAADYLNGTRCPSTPPASPPAPGSTDATAGATISFYNASDELVAQTDPLGNTTTYAYTSGVAGVPTGLMYCSVDPVDYQKGVACPAYGSPHVTGTTTATYDSAGDRTATTDADGNTTTYAYSIAAHPGLVSSNKDPDGTTTTYSYNGASEVTSQVVSFAGFSATTLFAYDSYGRRYCQVAPDQAAKGVTCPSQPPATAPTPTSDPYLGATITTYDADGRAIQVTNPLGGITYSAYDQAGNVFCTVTPAQAAHGTACPASAPSTPPTVGNDPYLGMTITTYDANRRPIQVTNPLGGITTTAYDQAGNAIQTTVESGSSSAPAIVTNTSYDADNRAVSTTVDPGGAMAATTNRSFDPDGNVYCSVSANAVEAGATAYQCPPWQAGWIAAPPNPTSLYSSTPTANQANNVTTTFYNADGQEEQTTNPVGDTSISVADGNGRTYCSSDPTNVASYLSAHPSASWPYLCPTTAPTSPPAQGSDPGYLTTLYDPAGRTISSTDQLGDTTSHTYAPGGQVLTTTDPNSHTTTNCYYYQDASGQCAANAPTDGGSGDYLYSATTPATSPDPSGETTTTTYTPGGKPDATTSPAGTATSAYDANGDLTSVTYTNTANGYTTPANLAYTYNLDGSRNSMTDASGTTTYSYNANGNITSQALTASSGLSNTTITYSYNPSGALAAITYPSYGNYTNPTVSYTYDPTGAMASETTWLGDQVTFTHDADGNPTSQANAVSTTNPNGTSATNFTYNSASQNTQTTTTLNQTCSGNPETLTQAFAGSGGARNSDGQLTQFTASYNGSCSGQTGTDRYYSYDEAGRVTYQGTNAQGTTANNFSYDPAGNPASLSAHDTSGSFNTYNQTFDNTGEITGQTPASGSQGSSSSYTYDTLGDQTSVTTGTTTQTFGYNSAGQMATYSNPTATQNYTYNGNGLEAASTGTSPHQLTWDNTGSLPLILSDSTNDYIYGPTGTPIEQINLSTSTPTYLTYTASNSTWISTNQTGDQTGYWGYDAYGTPAYGTPTSPFGYAGQYSDTTTRLSNMRARWYQSQTGGFTTRDPAFATTDTAYTYANGDPVNSGDPSGLITDGLCGSFAAEVGIPLWSAGWTGDACVVASQHNWGVSTTSGGLQNNLNLGLGVGGMGYFQVSNANSVTQLRGPFLAVSAGAQFGEGWGGVVFWSITPGPLVIGADVGYGVGVSLNASLWTTNTSVHVLPNLPSFLGSFARGRFNNLASTLGWDSGQQDAVLQQAQLIYDSYQAENNPASLLPCVTGTGSSAILV